MDTETKMRNERILNIISAVVSAVLYWIVYWLVYHQLVYPVFLLNTSYGVNTIADIGILFFFVLSFVPVVYFLSRGLLRLLEKRRNW